MNKTLLNSSLVASAILLSACSSDDDDKVFVEQPVLASKVAVHTAATDYVSGQQTILLDADDYSELSSGIGLTEVATDYTIRTHEDELYLLGKYNIDSIAKFDTNSTDPKAAEYTYSTQETAQETSGNPYDLVFVNDSKAYLVRYDANNILIVNPSATSEADFITGSIDLSSYKTASGSVNASDAHLVGDYLFVTMQRMENWVAQTAYVAVFDTTTDSEVETNFSTQDAVKGIALQGQNPLADAIFDFDGDLYVTTSASWGATDLSKSVLEKIDLDNYSVDVVLESEDIPGDDNKIIKEVIFASQTQGYAYVDTTDWTKSAVYSFNPSTGEFGDQIGTYFSAGESLSDIALDNQNRLWVSVFGGANPGLDVYSTQDNSLLENRIQFTLSPSRVEFLY